MKKIINRIINNNLEILFFTIFILLSTTGLWVNSDYLFYGYDGNFSFLNATKYRSWFSNSNFPGLPYDFLRGIGGTSFPINDFFQPTYYLSLLLNDTASKVTTYSLWAGLLYVITSKLGQLGGIGLETRVLSSWLLPLSTFPILGYPLFYGVIPVAPVNASIICLCWTICYLFLTQINQHGLQYLVRLGGIVLCVVFSVLAFPAGLVMLVPCVAICSLVATSSESSAKFAAVKLTLYIALFLVFLSLGVFHYIWDLLRYTAAYLLSNELKNERESAIFISILFGGKFESVICFLGTAGVIRRAKMHKNNYQEIVSIRVILACVIFQFSIACAQYVLKIKSISALYFEFMLWPIYFLFAADITLALIEKIFPKHLESSRAGKIFLILIIVVPLMITIRPTINPKEKFYVTESDQKLIDKLARELSLSSSHEFRGRVATMTGQRLGDGIGWPELNRLDYEKRIEFGTALRSLPFWRADIPTLWIYNPLVSPLTFHFLTYFLAKDSDYQVRNTLVLRKINNKILSLLGIRYVITDEKLTEDKGTKLSKLEFLEKSTSSNIYIYELKDVNTGNLSPTEVVISNSLRNTYKLLGSEKFDIFKSLILENPIEYDLSSAKSSSMSFRDGALHVRATSKGKRSILVLPIEFSNCFRVDSFTSTESPQLFRANGIFMGLLFEHSVDVEISYKHSPFTKGDCKSQDLRDFERLSK